MRYSHLGERLQDNANAVRFIRDDDRRELDGSTETMFWRKTGTIEKLNYHANYIAYWSQRRRLRSWEIRQGANAQLRSRLSADVSCVGSLQRFANDCHNHEL